MRARSKGWRVVVFNSRGCAESPVTTPKFYSASFTGDLRQVIDHVLCHYPQSNVYAVGLLEQIFLCATLARKLINALYLVQSPCAIHLTW